MMQSRLTAKLVLLLFAVSVMMPARAAGYSKYRAVDNADGTRSFYKNIPLKDFFGSTSTPNTGAGGGVAIKSADAIAIGSKGAITATATGITTAVEVLGVAKAIAGGPIGIAIFAVPLIADWLLANGSRVAPSGAALPFEVKKDQPDCTNGVCTEFSNDNIVWGTHVDACNEKFKAYSRNEYNINGGPIAPDLCRVIFKYLSNPPSNSDYPLYSRTSTQPPLTTWSPASYTDLSNKVADKPVPTGVVEALSAQGGEIPISYAPGSGFVPIDGPPSLDAPATVVTSTSGDTTTKTTSQDKTSLKYDVAVDPTTGKAAPVVTASTVNTSTTTTTNNSTGAVTTTNNTTTTKPDTPPEPPATDTPLPDQPKLYKQKYPDGMVGVYKTARDAIASSPLFTLAKNLMPSVAGGGNCPSMPVNLTFSSWANFGTKDVAPPCVVWDWGRAIIIVSALLLARSLIFGG